MHFIGDLSENDATILGEKAIRARRGILEFGCGGSTQLLANFSRPTVPMRSLDTEWLWIEKTQANMRRLGILREDPVDFQEWRPGKNDEEVTEGDWDLVFIDGLRAQRLPFANIAWRKLAIGGCLLWHDCRRPVDLGEILSFVGEHSNEVAALYLSIGESNLAAISKRNYLQQENWQAGTARWKFGGGSPPSPLPWPQA